MNLTVYQTITYCKIFLDFSLKNYYSIGRILKIGINKWTLKRNY